MSDEEWLKAAVADDSLVIQLLLRLSHSSPPPALPLYWTVRQPRSKSITLKSATAGASPTTPLSWSAATSHSGGAIDGFEEFSRPPPGSKVGGTSESIRTKKRKRKTMIELKDEEALLLKERKNLKRKIATLCVTLKEERATNESLKRMKMDLTMQAAAEGVTTFASEKPVSDQTSEMLAASEPDPFILPPSVTINDPAALPALSAPNNCLEVQKQKEVAKHENKFALPDLNVALVESSSEVLHVLS